MWWIDLKSRVNVTVRTCGSPFFFPTTLTRTTLFLLVYPCLQFQVNHVFLRLVVVVVVVVAIAIVGGTLIDFFPYLLLDLVVYISFFVYQRLVPSKQLVYHHVSSTPCRFQSEEQCWSY